MSFTSDEIKEAVEQIVLSEIPRAHDILGSRDVSQTHEKMQEASLGVFLMYRNSPFYILSLATQRLQELLTSEVEIIESLLTAIIATGRVALPITDLTPLANARSALFELESAIGNRTQSFKAIDQVPSYQRYVSNINRFLSTNGANVRDAGQIVQTPQEARNTLSGLINQLKALHIEVRRKVDLLIRARSNYDSASLPSTAAKGVLSRAREALTGRTTELEGLSAEERLSTLRAVVLELLTSKTVVKQYGSFTLKGDKLALEGVGSPYSDDTHLATSASSLATEYTYPICTTENILDFFLDAEYEAKLSTTLDSITAGDNIYEAKFNLAAGGFTAADIAISDVIYVLTGGNQYSRWVVKSVSDTELVGTSDHDPTLPSTSPQVEIWPSPSSSVTLSNSPIAQIEATLVEPFDIHSASGDIPATNVFKFAVNGTVITININNDPARITAYVVNQINIQAPAQMPSGVSVIAEGFFTPLKFEGLITTSNISPGIYRLSLVSSQLDGLNIEVGDMVKFKTGVLASASIPASITAIDGSSPITYVDISTSDPGTGTFLVQIGGPLRAIRLKCSGDSDCLDDQTTITILNDPSNTAATTLGFGLGISSQSKPQSADLIADDINGKTLDIVASAELVPQFTAHVRTHPLFPNRVTLYKFRGVGNVTAAFTTILVTVSAGGLIAAGVQIGDRLVLRTGADPDSEWNITLVSDTLITANGPGTSSASNVEIEIGESISDSLIQFQSLRISSPAQNQGDYDVVSLGPTDLDLELVQLMPIRQTSQKQPISAEALFGPKRVRFTSVDQTVDSSVLVKGSAAHHFFASQEVARGSSPWLSLPSIDADLEVDDLVEYYEDDYTTPTQTSIVTSIDKTLKVIGITPEINSDESWNFSQSSAPPFALLRPGKVIDTAGFETRLQAWLDQTNTQEAFFTDLNRYINPLLATNPTGVQINDAKQRLIDLYSLLSVAKATEVASDPENALEAILDSFKIAPIPSVDTLIRSLSEKGADKSLGHLLECDFSSFFNTTVDSSSYAGDMLLQMRTMARQDLPVRKVERKEAVQGQLLASVETVDYEYSGDDVERGLTPDPPIDKS